MKLLLIFLFLPAFCFSEINKVDSIKNDGPCSHIEYTYNEFHHTKQYNTAISLPISIADTSYYSNYNAVFYKYIEKGQTTYYLSLSTVTTVPDVNRKGVIIILKNGRRINKPNEIVKTEVETIRGESEHVVESFIRLLPNDILLLKSSPLKKFELYVDQDVVSQNDAIFQMFLCLVNKK